MIPQYCKHKETGLIYNGPIRIGKPGNLSKDNFSVYQRLDNKLAYLSPFPSIDYETNQYRETYNEDADILTYFSNYDRSVPKLVGK